MEKKEIRRLIFQRRALLAPKEIERESRIICEKIIRSRAFQMADSVYVYMDYNGEVSTKYLIEESWRQNKRVAAPKVIGDDMAYYYIRSYADVSPGYFHIPEPVTEETASDEEALLIVPGVGFDVNCRRCGYGKGFYDRYLSVHIKHTTIAVAFDFQIVEEVPCDSHDVLPQSLITPTGSYGAGHILI